jgi:Fic family protein
MFNPALPHELAPLPPRLSFSELTPDALAIFLKHHNLALKHVAELNGALQEIKNPDLFLSTFYLQESISSSAVENIYTTIESAMEDETRPEQERFPANKEVLHYRQALAVGIQFLEKYGLVSKTIKGIHKELKINKGVAGEYRSQQNSIANSKRDGTKEIIYTPPIAPQIEEHIQNWEKFANTDETFFPLVKTAICHYQFEAIHPFEDGNGRTGRILIVLQMLNEKMLNYPALFISGYLNENQDEYKRLLLNITKQEQGAWWVFIRFMLQGYSMQALKTRIALLQLKEARHEVRTRLYNSTEKVVREKYIAAVIDHIFQFPNTHAKFMAKHVGLHWQTCSTYLKFLATLDVLTLTPAGRYRFYKNNLALNALIVK